MLYGPHLFVHCEWSAEIEQARRARLESVQSNINPLEYYSDSANEDEVEEIDHKSSTSRFTAPLTAEQTALFEDSD